MSPSLFFACFRRVLPGTFPPYGNVRSVVVDSAAELYLSGNDIGVERVVVGVPKVFAEDGCAAAGGQEGWVLRCRILFSMEGAKSRFLGDGDMDDSPDALHVGGLHLQGAEMKVIWKHGAGMVAIEEEEGTGRRLEGNKLGEFLGTAHLLLELAAVEVQGTEGGAQKCESFVVSYRPSCRGFERVRC